MKRYVVKEAVLLDNAEYYDVWPGSLVIYSPEEINAYSRKLEPLFEQFDEIVNSGEYGINCTAECFLEEVVFLHSSWPMDDENIPQEIEEEVQILKDMMEDDTEARSPSGEVLISEEAFEFLKLNQTHSVVAYVRFFNSEKDPVIVLRTKEEDIAEVFDVL